MKIQSLFFSIVLFLGLSCSNSTNDNNTEKGTMPYNSNSETHTPDTGGNTTQYNNSTTGTTYSTTGSTTNPKNDRTNPILPNDSSNK
jgi:hypothetical protein